MIFRNVFDVIKENYAAFTIFWQRNVGKFSFGGLLAKSTESISALFHLASMLTSSTGFNDF